VGRTGAAGYLDERESVDGEKWKRRGEVEEERERRSGEEARS
jgi:hypothetical protein